MSIERDKEIIEAATPGPWHFGVYSRNDSRAGTMIGAVAPGHQIRTMHDGGTVPSFDGAFIATARNHWDALLDVAEALEDTLGLAHPVSGAEHEVVERADAALARLEEL